MNIITNTSIREKYHEGFARPENPSEIIIHGTGGGSSAQNLVEWMLRGERKEQYKKGVALFHFLIDYDGTITEIIDPSKWVYHSSSGIHDKKTIGIELMNVDMYNNAHYTDEQYESLLYLIFDVIMYSYDINVIMSHKRAKQKYSNGTKNCPGIYFEWDRIESGLINRGYKYDHDKRYESYYNIESF